MAGSVHCDGCCTFLSGINYSISTLHDSVSTLMYPKFSVHSHVYNIFCKLSFIQYSVSTHMWRTYTVMVPLLLHLCIRLQLLLSIHSHLSTILYPLSTNLCPLSLIQYILYTLMYPIFCIHSNVAGGVHCDGATIVAPLYPASITLSILMYMLQLIWIIS